MRWPWISREHHRDVVDAYRLLVQALHEQIDELEKRLAAPIAVSVTLPKDFAVIQPAIVQKPARKKKQQDGEVLPAAPNIDLADVDENDPKTLASLAFAKYNRKPTNTWELNQWIRGIKVEVQAAKAAKRRRMLDEAHEPAIKMEELQTGDEDDAVRPSAETIARIEAAERGED